MQQNSILFWCFCDDSHKLKFSQKGSFAIANRGLQFHLYLKVATGSSDCGKPNARLRLQLQENMRFYLLLTTIFHFTHCWNMGCWKKRLVLQLEKYPSSSEFHSERLACWPHCDEQNKDGSYPYSLCKDTRLSWTAMKKTGLNTVQ